MPQAARLDGRAATARPTPTRTAAPAAADESAPRDADERFIVGLVLSYYRRHPQRARTRLLDLLGEVLTPGAPAAPARGADTRMHDADEAHALWLRSQVGVAPLKQKR